MRTTIDDANDVFTLINTFTVTPHRQDAVVKSLQDFTEQHARFFEGFIGASVHASVDGHRVVNYVQWENHDDLAAMLASPPGKAHTAAVGALADQVEPVVYRVAYVGSRHRAV